MLYMGIDQHRKQLTICVQDETGEKLLRRQVSTRWNRVREFFAEFATRASESGGYVVCLEVCGFNDWLIQMLQHEYGSPAIILVQPRSHDRRKTDPRDAKQLSDILWINRDRISKSLPIEGVRRVMIPTDEQRDDRRLTALRQAVGRELTRVINRIKGILRRHNIEQDSPTKGIQTKAARAWLKNLSLNEIDRMEMDIMLERWEMLSRQRDVLEEKITARAEENADARQLRYLPGAGAYSALAIASRIGPIERFPRPRSLANFLGLTPSCRNSGESNKRLGSITKEGSAMVRFLLAQLTLHALRRDGAMRDWYKEIKRRRGAKIARVAVMRRLSTIIWHMLAKREGYRYGASRKQRRKEQENRRAHEKLNDAMRARKVT